MTFIAALRQDRIDATFLLDGPMNRFGFQAYIEKVLAPTLKPGDLVVGDNLPCHKRREVCAAKTTTGPTTGTAAGTGVTSAIDRTLRTNLSSKIP